MNYPASITDFFKSPAWVMNLLLAGVCMLIPVVGPMVVLGWLITILMVPPAPNMVTAPPFDFGKFGFYLERGLWPVLVSIVAAMGIAIVAMIVGMIPTFILGMVFGHGHGFFSMIGWLLGLFVWAAVYVAVLFVMVPIVIRSILVQDFMQSFDVNFIKRFISLMWKEILITVIFMYVAAFGLSIVGLVAFCIGIYAALAVINFMAIHLYRQLYQLYLSRGGEPIPVSLKLTAPAITPVA